MIKIKKHTPHISFKFLLIFSIAFLSIVLSGCTNVSERAPWKHTSELTSNFYSLQVGDIIIKNKTLHPLEWYGHIGLVVTPATVGDYPNPFTGYNETPTLLWLDENREVVVLRYKNFDEDFKRKFLENIEKYKDRPYWVTLSKDSDSSTYCSKYVWHIYKKTATDLNYDLDLDRDGGFIVFPYDFLEHPELEYIPF